MSNGDEKDGAGRGASRHADQHGQFGVGVPKLRTMDGGRRAAGMRVKAMFKGTQGGTSRHAYQYEKPCMDLDPLEQQEYGCGAIN